MGKKYDIFISYRRKSGFWIAQLLYKYLNDDGYAVSLDVENLRSANCEDYEKELERRIEECWAFILVLDEHCFDGTDKEEDSLLKEITHALRKNKNIIPLREEGFNLKEELPDGIKQIAKYHSPVLLKKRFSVSYGELKELLGGLQKEPRSSFTMLCNIDSNVYVDGEFKSEAVAGKPLKLDLAEGQHILQVECKATPQDKIIETIEKTDKAQVHPLVDLLAIRQKREKEEREKGILYLYGSNAEFRMRHVKGNLWMGETVVTQALWEAVMGNNPSKFKGENLPVESVRYTDIVGKDKFLERLRDMTCQEFRLPTSAEWECAARGGDKSHGYRYSGGDNIGDVAWYRDNAQRKTHSVNEEKEAKKPNELGLYGMSGNVWEKCQDGPRPGFHTTRGGGYNCEARYCEVTYSSDSSFDFQEDNQGFRLAMTR